MMAGRRDGPLWTRNRQIFFIFAVAAAAASAALLALAPHRTQLASSSWWAGRTVAQTDASSPTDPPPPQTPAPPTTAPPLPPVAACVTGLLRGFIFRGYYKTHKYVVDALDPDYFFVIEADPTFAAFGRTYDYQLEDLEHAEQYLRVVDKVYLGLSPVDKTSTDNNALAQPYAVYRPEGRYVDVGDTHHVQIRIHFKTRMCLEMLETREATARGGLPYEIVLRIRTDAWFHRPFPTLARIQEDMRVATEEHLAQGGAAPAGVGILGARGYSAAWFFVQDDFGIYDREAARVQFTQYRDMVNRTWERMPEGVHKCQERGMVTECIMIVRLMSHNILIRPLALYGDPDIDANKRSTDDSVWTTGSTPMTARTS